MHSSENTAGDEINAVGSQGFVNRPSGPVMQNFGGHVSYVLGSPEDGERDFFIPPLENYRPPHFTGPKIAEQFATRLHDRRLILFGGDPTVNKEALARHVAWLLNQLLEQETAEIDSQTPTPIKEWKRSGAMSVDIALHAYTASTIFILPQLLPQHISYKLQEFERFIKDRRHYVVATIDEDRVWQSVFDATVLKPFWQNLVAQDLFPPKYLLNVLHKNLVRAKDKLPKDLLAMALKNHLIGNRPINELAEELKTPENVADFVNQLCEGVAEGRKTEIVLDEYIKAAQDDLHRIRRWYHGLPSLRE